MQAIPSPRPIQPIPSLLVALTLTRAEVASASRRSISSRCGAEPGLLADHGGVDVDDPAADRADARCAAGRSSRRRATAPRRRGRGCRCRPSPAAPSSASITAWVRTSASEWPVEAALVLDLDPAEDRACGPRRSGGCRSRCRRRSSAQFSPTAAPSGSRRRSRPSKTQISLDPERAEELERPVVAEADLLGQVGVGGEREAGAGLDAHLGEGAATGRARRPACAARRSRPRPRSRLSAIASTAGS